jgi:hypothetical protein
MALVNLTSKYDLVGSFGKPDGEPVGNMENQKGPAWSIVGPGGTAFPVQKDYYPFNIPANSGLHAGPGQDQAGLSLLGPNYSYQYGNSPAIASFSIRDLDGEIAPWGPYTNVGPEDGFY